MREPGAGLLPRTLIALVLGQVCLHSCMTGVRMAAPLQALRAGHAEWTVGVLMGLFAAASVLLALPAGRLADRHGYHLPLKLAVGLTTAGGMVAFASTGLAANHFTAQFAALCGAAVLVGAGANIGLITILRTAGRSASGPTELKRVFSWLGLAPAVSNGIGPVLAGGLIDLGGFGLAFAMLALLPLPGLAWARSVPRERPVPAPAGSARRGSWDLLRTPGLGRLLFVNWLMSSSWDAHAFIVPVLGHERGFSASAIGFVLGTFAVAVAGVRALIPLLAHRLRESQVLFGATLWTAAVFAVYPLMRSAGPMAVCAALLGVSLGCVQPMIMTALHQITPEQRHGEAIALRSMTINLSSAVMPLLFGVLGAAIGAGSLFWLMAALVGAGSVQARHVGARAASVRT